MVQLVGCGSVFYFHTTRVGYRVMALRSSGSKTIQTCMGKAHAILHMMFEFSPVRAQLIVVLETDHFSGMCGIRLLLGLRCCAVRLVVDPHSNERYPAPFKLYMVLTSVQVIFPFSISSNTRWDHVRTFCHGRHIMSVVTSCRCLICCRRSAGSRAL